MKRVFGIVLVMMVSCSGGWAQKIVPSAAFVLNLDYAKFRNNDSTGYLEIYYGFYPGLMTFDLHDGRYVGVLAVSTRIRDAQSGAYYVHERSNVPVIIADTSAPSLHSTYVSQVGYALPFGEYTLQVLIVDTLAPSRRDSIELPLSFKGYPDSVTFSDIELCSNIKSSTEKRDLFYKNSLEVMPNPTLVFGATSYPMMFHYVELYNLNPELSYSVKTEIVGAGGKPVKESSKSRTYGMKNAVEAAATNVASIPSGKYLFRLTLSDESGTLLTQSNKTFYVYNPHITATRMSAASVKASELAGLTADELAKEFREGQYVATDQEIKMFSQITTAEGRREFLAKFWTEVEDGRLGHPGIPRTVYLQRILEANKRFHAMGREGWRTDRGRVLILYAEPDEIERFPSSENSKPYEIWHYYAIENGVEFVFVERSGFGDYILVHSTKRGELQDDQWQRFLQ
jgi:GWxTD domain-containing protein